MRAPFFLSSLSRALRISDTHSMFSWFRSYSFTRGFISVFLLCSVVLTAYTPLLYPPEVVEAQLVVTDPGNTWQSILSVFEEAGIWAESILSTAYTYILQYKETFLDPGVWMLINLVLHTLSQQIVSWINSGFSGSPAFVADFNGFLRGIADRAAGEFIYGTELGFLCSPFRLNIQLALAIQYGKGRSFDQDARCSLTGVVSNIQNFMNGDFFSGGWDGWFHMTQTPQNNPYGALLLAQEELSIRLSTARSGEIKLLDFSKGFFNKRVCTEGPAGGDAECHTVTPGSAIENQLNSALNLPAGRLLVADEFNEILAALFGQLVNRVFTGAGGLLGLTNSSYGGNSGTYYNQLANETTYVGVSSAQCGYASGARVVMAPTRDLCLAGTPSAVTGTGPWTWTCSSPEATVTCTTDTQTGLLPPLPTTPPPGGGGGGACPATNPQGIPYNNALPIAPMIDWTAQELYNYWLSIPIQSEISDTGYSIWDTPVRFQMVSLGTFTYRYDFYNLIINNIFGGDNIAYSNWINGNYYARGGAANFDQNTGIGTYLNFAGVTETIYPPSGIPRPIACTP